MQIAIIGTGTMGKGIAQVFSQFEGYDVFLCGRTMSSAEKAVDIIHSKFEKLTSKGKISADEVDAAMSRIHCGDWEYSYQCDLIIESVPEDFQTKVDVISSIAPHTKGQIVTNTSSLSLQKLQEFTNYPLVGMHFFNPVPVMKLVEVVFTEKNLDEQIQRIRNTALSVGKDPILVKDNPGMIVNRLLITMINEAVLQYDSGVASAEDIDKAMRLGANFPMGPLELADYIGIDVVLAIMKSIEEQTGNQKYEPANLLLKMVAENKLGRKSGQGFYRY